MGEAARKLSTAAERRAALLALPLRPEPPTAEEAAAFRDIQPEVDAGSPTIPHAEGVAELFSRLAGRD